MSYRVEKDLLGEMNIPENAYYGIQTMRAAENFQITGITLTSNPTMICSLAYVKKAAAITNMKLGHLDEKIGNAIVMACDKISEGKYNDQFIVDMMQGGAGTSTNMNANEVIANVALEITGNIKGDYSKINPNDHVNMSQSTNDAYPTAFRIALYICIEQLLDSVEMLKKSFRKKENEFSKILKMGRTQLQDAVPMTLGQEFGAYAETIDEDMKRIKEARKLITEINMGATAIGTGINSHADYSDIICKELRIITGIPLSLSRDFIEATQDTGAYIQVSGVLKRYAVKLSKICNDLRLLSSGPRAGFNEINLPKMQPGSSIMPGKVNPVIPEVVNQVAFQVVGNDLTITMAAEAGQLELNVMEPVIAFRLFDTINILTNASLTLSIKCINGITANADVCRYYVEHSIGLITALVPYLGYDVCSEIAKEALKDNRSVYQLVLEKNIISKESLDIILSPENMAGIRRKKDKGLNGKL
ncbi:aspartate ammonia-lyase [soil metagenome]